MRVYCHSTGCGNLIRNDRALGDEEVGERSHILVQSVPYCLECYTRYMGDPLVNGVVVREEDVTLVLGKEPVDEPFPETDSELDSGPVTRSDT